MSIGHSRLRIFCSKSFTQSSDRFRLSLHEELDHFLEENALEFFEAARFERAAFDDDFAVASEERVVLRLVAEHGVELLVEFDFDAGRQFFRETGAALRSDVVAAVPAAPLIAGDTPASTAIGGTK